MDLCDEELAIFSFVTVFMMGLEDLLPSSAALLPAQQQPLSRAAFRSGIVCTEAGQLTIQNMRRDYFSFRPSSNLCTGRLFVQ